MDSVCGCAVGVDTRRRYAVDGAWYHSAMGHNFDAGVVMTDRPTIEMVRDILIADASRGDDEAVEALKRFYPELGEVLELLGYYIAEFGADDAS